MEANHNSLSRQRHLELPFEILGIVFAYYVETETLFHPLETLLLVSRLWNLVALGHKALWGDLRIHLGHKPTHDAWRTILPRRLKRAGSAPLNIEIKYALKGIDHPYYDRTITCAREGDDNDTTSGCSCIRYASRSAHDLLGVLAGPEGEYCKRWMKLHITLDVSYRRRHGDVPQLPPSSSLSHPLSYPMPLLERIHLKGLKLLE